jgi:hypothetical protein
LHTYRLLGYVMKSMVDTDCISGQCTCFVWFIQQHFLQDLTYANRSQTYTGSVGLPFHRDLSGSCRCCWPLRPRFARVRAPTKRMKAILNSTITERYTSDSRNASIRLLECFVAVPFSSLVASPAYCSVRAMDACSKTHVSQSSVPNIWSETRYPSSSPSTCSSNPWRINGSTSPRGR